MMIIMNYALFIRPIIPLMAEPKDLFDDGTSGIDDEALCGHKCCFEGDGEGVYVTTAYRYNGWVKKSDLLIIDEETYNTRECDPTLRFVSAAIIDVLSLPKVQGRQLITIPRGSIVSLIAPPEEKGGWAKVRCAGGEVGYVKEGQLMPYYSKPISDDENEFRKAVTAQAKRYLGTQYRWAGKSPFGIDCSGLCSMAYMLCGVYIYRDAKMVEGFPVHAITLDEAKPGDLLYFPGHIAMYLGEGRYIHSTGANGSDGVVYNSMNEGDEGYRPDLVEKLIAVGSIF